MLGQFITIEGIECVGKSTNAKYIETMLNKKGYKTLLTREPGGSGIGEKMHPMGRLVSAHNYGWVVHVRP